MIKKSHLLFMVFLIFIFSSISGCAVRGKIDPAGRSENHREVAAVERNSQQPSVPTESLESATLENYLHYAALHNPDLEAAFNRWKASQEMIPQVQSLPDPQLTIETNASPRNSKIEVAQMFPWYGTRALRGDVARKESREFLEKFEAMKTVMFFKVKLAYFEYYYLSRSIDITHKNLELMTGLENSARIRYTSGKASYADVIKAQVEIAKLEERMISLKELERPFTTELNALLNRAIDKELPAPVSLPDYNLTMDEKSLYALMKEKNPELRELLVQIDRETDNINLASKQFYPDLMVGLSYNKTSMAGGADNGNNPLMTMVGVNLPVWRDKYRSAVREAEVNRKSAVSSKTARENSLQAELNRALYDYRDAERKIGLYRDVLIPKAQESLDVSTLAYAAGAADFLDLLYAQSTLLDLELMYERELSNSARSFARLEMLAGKDLTDENTR